MGLLFVFISAMYLDEALITHDFNVPIPPIDDIYAESINFQKLSDGFLVLTYTTIFSVKISFLLFFRHLISRALPMTVYWWAVTAITIVAWMFGVSGFFITCPYFDLRSLSCAAGNQLEKTLAIGGTTIALDILTDLLIIAIPIRMLWSVRIKFQQKIAIGATLCLSAAMVVTCIIQISGLESSAGSIDVTWGTFWQLAEACIAVLMVSLTALRSLFVMHASRLPKFPRPSWSSKHANKWLKNLKLKKLEQSSSSFGSNQPPEVPRAVLNSATTRTGDEGEDLWKDIYRLYHHGQSRAGSTSETGTARQSGRPIGLNIVTHSV